MPSEPDVSREREIPSLAPMDRGRQAWSFIAAGFAIEMLLWGGLFSTGVFLKHYSTNEVSVRMRMRSGPVRLGLTDFPPP